MTTATTPSMAQFFEIKEAHPDCLLFFQMGDFYELFFDDAVAAAAALDIALTKRGKHHGEDIAMCGVPLHAATGYLLTLIRKGFRVAICDQVESPAEAKKRGSKSVVRREVVRVVTPGTLTEDSLLDARQHNYLASLADIRGRFAVGWVDLSTGDIGTAEIERPRLGALLARLAPREVLVQEGAFDDGLLSTLLDDLGIAATELGAASFDSAASARRLETLYGVDSLDGFGTFERVEISALGALADYLMLTQKGKLPLLKPPVRERAGGIMLIDAATRRNLELTHALSGGREGALLAAIDRTLTGAGARLLEQRLVAPLTDPAEIARRHDAVATFVEDRTLGDAIRDVLRSVPEIERAMTRLSLERAGPRDLAALRAGLRGAEAIATSLRTETDLAPLLGDAAEALTGHDPLIDLLSGALCEDPPLMARDGGFVADGWREDLDAARQMRDESRKVIEGIRETHARETGIAALKIRTNNVLGYFVEVPAQHAQTLMSPPHGETFIHRQTLANAVRFTTVRLSELEQEILSAGARAHEIETAVFAELSEACLAVRDRILGAARALAEMDVATAHARLAIENRWTRPVVRANRNFRIVAGRHPVVEQALVRDGAAFVANDCDLGADATGPAPLWLLTGPNMAGKSTFLRQNALIAILAQAGLFVPAAEAEIGIVDQVFSRVGAADDLARGRSTFMVEMVETAAILNQAGPNALVILDEIGRGTATWDGLSIAWATVEYLHEQNRCRGLFATHYHELTALCERLDALHPATVAVREWEGEVIFLHEVRAGAADRSYGVQVAKLAGLPEAVIARARAVLEQLEDGARQGQGAAAALEADLPLFSAHVPQPLQRPAEASALDARMREVLPDTLSPRDALDLVYELRALVDKDGG